MVGKTFFDYLVPFVAARGFGGPVFWELEGESVTGSDAFFYVAGGGLLVQVPGRFSIFAEALPLGAASFAVGATVPL